MTHQELLDFRTRLGWSLAELGRRLQISPSRLADYETGHTRGRARRPAPIPKVVELACRWLEHEEDRKRPLSPLERAALWRNFLSGLPQIEHVVDDRREAIYDPDRGR